MGHQADQGMRGVFVLGMHRSGTSATMQALAQMGVPTCRESDFIPGLKGNPRGHFESGTLVAANKELLARAGGFWWSPPSDDAISSAASEEFVMSARRRFLNVHTTAQWACKDPSCCLTLSFWAGALDVSPIILAVSRNPAEVASSLHRRSGLPKSLGLALWERYTRAMLSHISGRAAVISDYADLLENPATWAASVHDFLSTCGLSLPPLDRGRVASSLEPGLRHRRIELSELKRDPEVTASQVELYRLVVGLAGASQQWEGIPLPPESTGMDRRLRRARRLDSRVRSRLRRTLRATHSGR